MPVGKNGMTDANQKPCAKSATQRLDADPLSLFAPDDPSTKAESVKVANFVIGGGYLDLSFFGVETGLEEFTYGTKKIPEGNPKGVVEVLNIPYCTKASDTKDNTAEWRSRCLNRRTLKILEKDDVLQKFISKFQTPKLFHKMCTGHLAIDPDDLSNPTGSQRVRVWTAEHCYQPSYTAGVTLYAYLPPEKAKKVFGGSDGKYIPLELTAPDAAVWRTKVLAKGGGGGAANDPLLDEKVLILRSMDGRSSELYMKTHNNYCLNFNLPERGEYKVDKLQLGLENRDCFAMTDTTTFKGTISSNQPPVTRFYNEAFGRMENSKLALGRKAALDSLVEEAQKKSEGTFEDTFRSTVSSLGRLGQALPKYLSFKKMVIATFEGAQHARRVQALKYEKSTNLKNLLSSKGILNSNESLTSKMETFNDFFSTPLMLNHQLNIANIATAGILSFLGTDCANALTTKIEFQPPDNSQLEEIALGKKNSSCTDYFAQRSNVLLLTLFNSAGSAADRGLNNQNSSMAVGHPLRISSTDSFYVANLKHASFVYKSILDIMMNNKNPGLGNEELGKISRAAQDVLNGLCSYGAQGRIATWFFPIQGNLEKSDGTQNQTQNFKLTKYGSISPVKNEIMPLNNAFRLFGIGAFDPEQYPESSCTKSSSQALPGSPLQLLPASRELSFAVHLDDFALNKTATEMSKEVDNPLLDYVSSRVLIRFPAKDEKKQKDFLVTHSDSGALMLFAGMPVFALSTHNGEPVNGVVLAELPDVNNPDDPDAVAGDGGGAGSARCRP